MVYPEISNTLIALRDHDLKVRQRLLTEGKLFDGYNPEMEAVHLDNAAKLTEIIKTIGYPTIEKVGTEGSDAAWLVIQHAISLPDFMKSCLALAKIEAANNKVNPVNVAYLEDRIAMFEERPQKYGTQFVTGDHGEAEVYQLDDSSEVVNERRKPLGLPLLEAAIAEFRDQLKKGWQTRTDRRRNRRA